MADDTDALLDATTALLLPLLGALEALAHAGRQLHPPALSEVVACCPPRMRFQFEIKTLRRGDRDTLTHALKKLLQRDQLHERVVVTATDTALLRRLARAEPRMTRGLIAQYRFEQPLRRARALGCGWLIAHRNLLNRRLVNAAHKRGMGVSVWTVNDVAEARQMEAMGVDSLITDYPTRMLAHFTPPRCSTGVEKGADLG